MAGVTLVHEDPLGEDPSGEDSQVQGRKRSRKQSRPQPSISNVPEWDPSSRGRESVSKGVSRYPNAKSNSRKGSRMGSEPKGEQIKASEVIYYTERLKEYYDRSDDDVTSTISSGQKRKYLDQLKGQLKIGEKDQSKAVVPYDPDPTGIKKKLQPLGKDDLMNLVVNMAKKLEGAGKSAEIQRLLDTALSAPTAKPTIGRDLTGIDRILKDGFLTFLVKVRQHLPRFPPQVVKFKGVTYGAELRDAKQGFETVGSTVMKCLFACCAERQGMHEFKVLDNCSGYLMPGTLTLVCGPPGCGYGQGRAVYTKHWLEDYVDKHTTLQGSVTYNHNTLDKIQVRRLAAYIAQTDRHLPILTVRETCEFANAFSSHFANNPEWFGKNAKKMEALQDEIGGVNLPLELTLHLLGLRGVSDTIVGNAAVRGFSGGERHRVTTAEMVSGTFLVYLLDEISTGLDSPATYDIVSAFRTMARIRRYTCLFSLLQPSPEVFNLFDRIILMHEGRIIYQGPRDDVLLYFKKLGYVKPNHVDVADFLQEISTEEGAGYLTPGQKHLTIDDFVSAYMASDMYKDIVRILDEQEEVESTGTTTIVDIQQTSQVKAGDKITAIGSNHESLEYLALPGTQAYLTSDAVTVVDKVQRAQDYVRLQLERPLEQVPPETAKIFDKEYVQDWWTSTKVVMKLLELNDIEDKLVGSIGDGGLSVEEAKRLTIGAELVANPSILFLGEPTSGLDSLSKKSMIWARLSTELSGSTKSGQLGKEPLIKGYGASYWVLCKVVVLRQFRTCWRNISYSFRRMMSMILLGLILGSTFYKIKYNTGMVSRVGLIYISVVMVAVSNASNVIPQVNAERVVYYRERASNMYPVLFYSMSWTFAEIPYLYISTLFFCSICFSLGGIATGSLREFFEFWFAFCEYAACITLFGIFLAMMTPNAQVATIFVPIVVNLWNMTSGFMITKSKIPNFWIWLYWVNPTQYTINTLTSIAFYCDVGTPPCDTCSLLPNSCPECPCVRVADQNNLLAWLIMKNSMSLDYDARHKNMGMLGLFICMFMVASAIALRFMKYDRR